MSARRGQRVTLGGLMGVVAVAALLSAFVAWWEEGAYLVGMLASASAAFLGPSMFAARLRSRLDARGVRRVAARLALSAAALAFLAWWGLARGGRLLGNLGAPSRPAWAVPAFVLVASAVGSAAFVLGWTAAMLDDPAARARSAMTFGFLVAFLTCPFVLMVGLFAVDLIEKLIAPAR